RYLYAVSEAQDDSGTLGGALSAFSIESGTGKLTAINHQSSVGAGPCHVGVDKTGACVYVANYGSGSVAAFKVRPDGGLDAASDFVQHEGSSVDKSRQSGPHAHSI